MDDPDEMRRRLIETSLKTKLPIAVLDPTCKWTTTKDQAAIAALNAVNSNKYEEGGAIFRNDQGEYCYSIPVGSQKQGSIRFAINPQKGLVLDGIYHTHPSDGRDATRNGRFSDDDVQMAEALQVTSYIKSIESGLIKKFNPGDRTQKKPGRIKSVFAEGEVVAKQTP